MGMLQITTRGSFGPMTKTFTAQSSGHAVAVDDAIAFLRQTMLPAARVQDQELRAQGAAPDDGFAEADRRGLLADEPGQAEAELLSESPAFAETA
jgi:hypothetical protein